MVDLDLQENRLIDLKQYIDDEFFCHIFNFQILRGYSDSVLTKKDMGFVGEEIMLHPIAIYYHLKITPLVEERISKSLFPTYCFTRKYGPESTLGFHTDRPACEISVSYCHEGESWPFFLLENNKMSSYELKPGLGILYKGEEIHGRATKNKNSVLQTFFHWVEKNGPYDKYKYDESDITKQQYELTKRNFL